MRRGEWWVINRFTTGIWLDFSANRVIEGNFIGTDATGTNALANESGIVIYGEGNQVGGTTPAARNIVSGNSYGVYFGGSNVVVGNFIGLSADGATTLPQTFGIYVNNGLQTRIGGFTPGARNVISGNANGCLFNVGASNVVQGNYIGTDASGTLARGNLNGIVLQESSRNLIGGAGAGTGNLLSGNSAQGVFIAGSYASNNVVAGNLIGPDVTGTNLLGNGNYGVSINSGSGNVIGGTTAGAGNVVSGNIYQGIAILYAPATGNVVQGNFIGTDITGTLA